MHQCLFYRTSFIRAIFIISKTVSKVNAHMNSYFLFLSIGVVPPLTDLLCSGLGSHVLSRCLLQMNEIVDASQSSTQELQEQIDIYKEKNRRELADLQRQLKDRELELERSQGAARSLQEEVRFSPPAYHKLPSRVLSASRHHRINDSYN